MGRLQTNEVEFAPLDQPLSRFLLSRPRASPNARHRRLESNLTSVCLSETRRIHHTSLLLQTLHTIVSWCLCFPAAQDASKTRLIAQSLFTTVTCVFPGNVVGFTVSRRVRVANHARLERVAGVDPPVAEVG